MKVFINNKEHMLKDIYNSLFEISNILNMKDGKKDSKLKEKYYFKEYEDWNNQLNGISYNIENEKGTEEVIRLFDPFLGSGSLTLGLIYFLGLKGFKKFEVVTNDFLYNDNIIKGRKQEKLLKAVLEVNRKYYPVNVEEKPLSVFNKEKPYFVLFDLTIVSPKSSDKYSGLITKNKDFIKFKIPKNMSNHILIDINDKLRSLNFEFNFFKEKKIYCSKLYELLSKDKIKLLNNKQFNRIVRDEITKNEKNVKELIFLFLDFFDKNKDIKNEKNEIITFSREGSNENLMAPDKIIYKEIDFEIYKEKFSEIKDSESEKHYIQDILDIVFDKKNFKLCYQYYLKLLISGESINEK